MAQEELRHVHISAEHRWLDLKLGEVFRYRDLIGLFVRRSFKVSYKQTILGPAWILINPMLTSIVHMILFGNIAKLSTDGVPQILFYLVGTALWGFFSGSLTGNASTFTGNAGLFGKVYFPRLTVPISGILSGMLRFAIQMILVVLLMAYFRLRGEIAPHPLAWLILPVVLLQMGLMGMAIGILISSVTTKYRDLSVLVGFGVSLWMYGTPVVYPLSQIPRGTLRTLICLNPMTADMELFRWALFGCGRPMWGGFLASCGVTAVLLFLGIMVFNRVERSFMDTV